jgi:hypothetical protein
VRLADAAEQKVYSSLSRLPAWTRRRSRASFLVAFTLFRRPRFLAGRRRGGQGREAPGSTLARRDGGWQVLSFDFACPISRQRFSLLGSQTEPRKRGPKGGLIGLQSAFYEFVGPAGAPSRSHSSSFDHRRRPEMLRTAIATAFFWPTITTSRLPRVTPV